MLIYVEHMEISSQIAGNGFSMKDLLAKSGFELPKVGQVVSGEIISVSKNAVTIDMGPLGTGIVYPGEFYDNPERMRALKPGDMVSAMLIELENEEGYRELSLRSAQMTTAWQDIKEKMDKEEIVTTTVININKGGLIVEVSGVQGFLPLSQLSPEHYPKVEGGDTTKIVQALQKLRGQEIQVKILDFSEAENRLIVSERAINDALVKQELEKFNIGDLVEAKITDVTDFGAFAIIETPDTQQPELLPTEEAAKPRQVVEGLIHISEIDWKIVDNPRDFLKQGDKVKAKIIGIENGKVSLSLKAIKPNPWDKVQDTHQVGQTLEGTVIKISNYGVIINLSDDFNGLLPSSEFGENTQLDTINVGDKISVAIVSLDTKERKINLTLSKK